MANIIIKSEERRQHDNYVLETFKQGAAVTQSDRDAAECIAARTREAFQNLKQMEEKNR